jgi:hypothetical protein
MLPGAALEIVDHLRRRFAEGSHGMERVGDFAIGKRFCMQKPIPAKGVVAGRDPWKFSHTALIVLGNPKHHSKHNWNFIDSMDVR